MKIAIIGTGGVGGYFGGKLAKTGFDVTFLARGKHLEAIKTHGLKIKSIKGDFDIPNAQATDNIQQMGQSDLIMLGVKAWQVKDLAAELSSIMHSKTLVLPLQNGVNAIEDLKSAIPADQIIGGLCRIVSKIEEPGVINHFAAEPIVVFGEMDNVVTERLQTIKNAFDKAGFDNRIAEDINVELWKKFMAICSGGLLAVTRSTFGQVRELPETRNMLRKMFEEIHGLAQKVGVNIKADYIEKAMAFVDAFQYDVASSMARDIWEGRPSEIDYHNGTVVKIAAAYGVDVPVNKFIYHSILPLEIRARNKN